MVLDDELDGRYLFELSTRRYNASLKGESAEDTDDFSKIVMVDSVLEARNRGVLIKEKAIKYFTEGYIVTENKQLPIDAIDFCTGFKNQLNHLAGLNLNPDLNAISEGTQSRDYQNLWFVGYGEWLCFCNNCRRAKARERCGECNQ